MATTERKLAAILSADVVGYSRLMAEDEAGTIRTLGAYRDEIRLLVEQHRGRVADFTGDNFLAEFPTVLDAVECALEVQRVLKARNASLSENRRMEFRIGVHLGDVTAEDGRLYGDGVNIAARLEGLAEPGGICVSAEVRSQIQRRLELDFDDLGKQTVKNIPDPVHAYRVREAAAGASRPASRPIARWGLAAVAVIVLVVLGLLTQRSWSPAPPADGPPLTSIAVLPFEDMSPGRDQGWLADGMAEELIETLSRIEALLVMARTSAFTLRGKDIRSVGAELNVGSVVEGSVRRSNNRLRMTAQLIRVADGFHLWSGRYDRQLDDVFAVQEEIAREIAEALRAELGVEDTWSPLRRSRYAPQDIRAYELVKRGFELRMNFTEEGMRKAIPHFLQALEIDPDYADAHAQLAWAEYLLFTLGHAPGDATYSRARASALRALALDASNGAAHALLATLSTREWDWEAAERRLQHAIPLNPAHSGLHATYGSLLLEMGQLEAAAARMQRAIEIDPLWAANRFAMAVAHWLAGNDDAAIEQLERALELNPDEPFAAWLLAVVYDRNGMQAEALDAAIRAAPAELEQALRRAYAADGWRGITRVVLQAQIAQTGRPCTGNPAIGARFYAVLGDGNGMYACLDEALAQRRGPLMLKASPEFAPYREDPRFTALVRRMNLGQ